MTNQAWEDAFQELWDHATHHRGVREALADRVGSAPSDALHQWPRTRWRGTRDRHAGARHAPGAMTRRARPGRLIYSGRPDRA